MRASLALLASLSMTAVQVHSAEPPPPAAETVAPDIPGVVAGGTHIKVIREGFQGTEGPIALPDGTLLFTETTASRLVKIDADDHISTFMEGTNGSNALAFDPHGRWISVQTTPGKTQVGAIFPEWKRETLQDNIDGRPNDLVITLEGGIYYTVPGASQMPAGTLPRATPFVPAVFYIAPGKPAIKVADGIANPNGIQLSPDEHTLYVNDTRGEHLIAFDRARDGTLLHRRDFATYQGVTTTDTGVTSGADGLAIDASGRVYAATTIGIQVFSVKGELLGTIPISRRPQNLAFAGANKQTLYIVGSGAAYRVQMLSHGFTGRAK